MFMDLLFIYLPILIIITYPPFVSEYTAEVLFVILTIIILIRISVVLHNNR